MAERPILFSAPMVRAILNGSKTQTRRVAKKEPIYDSRFAGGWKLQVKDGREAALCSPLVADLCPYGQPGDRLWVRETWAFDDEDATYCYRADLGLGGDADDWERNRLEGAPRFRWKPSIHMRRKASRIDLEITRVRIELLQDISEADAIAEGVTNSLHLQGGRTARENFEHLWWAINGDGAWEQNPWVWVVEFQRKQTHRE